MMSESEKDPDSDDRPEAVAARRDHSTRDWTPIVGSGKRESSTTLAEYGYSAWTTFLDAKP